MTRSEKKKINNKKFDDYQIEKYLISIDYQIIRKVEQINYPGFTASIIAEIM